MSRHFSRPMRLVFAFIARFKRNTGRFPTAYQCRTNAYTGRVALERLVDRGFVTVDRKGNPSGFGSEGFALALELQRKEALNPPRPTARPAPMERGTFAGQSEEIVLLHDHWVRRQGGWLPKIGAGLSPDVMARTVRFLKLPPLPSP